MLNSSRYMVEGKFDKITLNKIGIYNVYVGNGKENVIRQFRIASNGCFLVDGNDEGFNGIANRFVNLNASLNPPIISIGNRKLIVVGDSENGYKGSMESILLKMIEISKEENNVITQFLQKVSLTNAQRDKVSLIMATFLRTQDYQIFFSIDRFASCVVEFLGRDKIRKKLEELRII